MSIKFQTQIRKPGIETNLQTADLIFDYGDQFTNQIAEGYKNLLYAAMKGNQSLFSGEQVETARNIVMPILNAWKLNTKFIIPRYSANEESICEVADFNKVKMTNEMCDVLS